MSAERIILPAEPHDSLDWSEALARAKSVEGPLLWQMRLGLERLAFHDLTRLNALALSLKQFTSEVWPLFSSRTAGLVLYQGPLDGERLSSMEELAIYHLPDELEVLLLFDERGIPSAAKALQLLSKERFAHFTLGLRTERLKRDALAWDEEGKLERRIFVRTEALVFPEKSEPELLRRFDEALEHFGGKVILESFLADEWGGLDRLFVLEGSLTAQAARKLKGFEAAGGEVVMVKNRGRGI